MSPFPTKITSHLIALSAPLASTLLAMTGVGFYFTFISLHFASLNHNEFTIGIIQASYFLGLFIGAWKIDTFVKRIGSIQVLAGSGTLLTITNLLQAFSDNLLLWIITRILAGLALAAFYVVIECWMIENIEVKKRGTILSLYMLILNAGYIIGQQIIPRISLHSSAGFIIAALLASASVIPIALSTKKLTPPEHENPLKFSTIFKASPLGAAGCLTSGFAMSAIYSFLALTSRHFSIPGPQLVSIFILGGLIAQWPIGRLSDYFDRRKVLIALALILLSSSLLLLLPPIHHSLTYLFVACVGIGSFTLYPISINLTTDRLQHKHFTKAMATLLLTYGVGSSLGPLLSSLAIHWLENTGLFLYLSLIGTFLTLVAIYALKRPPVPLDEKEDYSPSPRTTPTAFRLKKPKE